MRCSSKSSAATSQAHSTERLNSGATKTDLAIIQRAAEAAFNLDYAIHRAGVMIDRFTQSDGLMPRRLRVIDGKLATNEARLTPSQAFIEHTERELAAVHDVMSLITLIRGKGVRTQIEQSLANYDRRLAEYRMKGSGGSGLHST
jgi:hypothetical protein